MSKPEQDSKSHRETMPAPTAPPSEDVENQTAAPRSGFGVPGILRRWRREDLLQRGSVVLRGLALLFSLLSLLITASNKHGYWRDFDKYEEYRYLLAIAILSTLYTAAQSVRHAQELSSGRSFFPQPTSAMVDFVGDQIVAYLLLSSASAAIPLTNNLRVGQDSIFTDSSAAAISMSIFAFSAMASSAVVSGYKLSTQSYV